MNRFKWAVMFPLVLVSALGCQDGSSVGGTETGNAGESNIAAVVTSLFGNQSEGASIKRAPLPYRLVALMVKSAYAQQMFSACDMAKQAPADVTISASITAGTYGLSTNSVSAEASDGCAQGGEYAAFTVASHSMICVDGDANRSTVTMEDSTGIFRENITLNRTEIYGMFTISNGLETVQGVRCSLTINHQEGLQNEFGGGCENSSGVAIEQISDVICTDQ